MAKGPTPKEKKTKVLGYRAPPHMEAWVAAKQTGGANQSDVMAWAMNLAHDYYEAAKQLDGRIKALAKSNDMTQLGILKKILERGVETLEQELAAKRK